MQANSLHIQWNPPWNPNWINAGNALEFFANPMNPFYDINCLNEQVRVQRLAPEVLARAQGIEYALLHAAEPLFTIRKQYRNSPTSVVPLDDYYIIGGTVYQAPDFCSVLNSRIQSALNHVGAAFEEAKSYYRFHPSKGYWWQFKGYSSIDLG
ncbi:unnamed protein product [Soboliphyme baturini]|uniref:Mediator of RNA polymerase II transcription subunit 6 n=1 Tax=Soboliphyme baturini TaxID=241478 RepID=A0A183ICP3_9BILA|nr:unnamed protein product [Soboliphyme baturini]